MRRALCGVLLVVVVSLCCRVFRWADQAFAASQRVCFSSGGTECLYRTELFKRFGRGIRGGFAVGCGSVGAGGRGGVGADFAGGGFANECVGVRNAGCGGDAV